MSGYLICTSSDFKISRKDNIILEKVFYPQYNYIEYSSCCEELNSVTWSFISIVCHGTIQLSHPAIMPAGTMIYCKDTRLEPEWGICLLMLQRNYQIIANIVISFSNHYSVELGYISEKHSTAYATSCLGHQLGINQIFSKLFKSS